MGRDRDVRHRLVPWVDESRVGASVTKRAKVERLRRWMHRNRLLFVKVGAYAHEDRVIDTTAETPDGAMVNSREYTALLRAIVEALE